MRSRSLAYIFLHKSQYMNYNLYLYALKSQYNYAHIDHGNCLVRVAKHVRCRSEDYAIHRRPLAMTQRCRHDLDDLNRSGIPETTWKCWKIIVHVRIKRNEKTHAFIPAGNGFCRLMRSIVLLQKLLQHTKHSHN